MKILEFILNNKDYLEDLITRSTYHSNAIEGSTLTYAETYAIIYNDNSIKIGNGNKIEKSLQKERKGKVITSGMRGITGHPTDI